MWRQNFTMSLYNIEVEGNEEFCCFNYGSCQNVQIFQSYFISVVSGHPYETKTSIKFKKNNDQDITLTNWKSRLLDLDILPNVKGGVWKPSISVDV